MTRLSALNQSVVKLALMVSLIPGASKALAGALPEEPALTEKQTTVARPFAADAPAISDPVQMLATAANSPASEAQSSSITDFTPYRARYTSDWQYGLTLTGEATRELRKTADDDWVHSLEAKVGSLVRHYEESRLTIEGPLIKPLDYRYERKILNRERNAHLHFDWKDQQVINKVGDDAAWKMMLPKGTQDHLSYQLQLRYDLLMNKADLHYQIADGGHLKAYGFEVLGEEKLDTPLGTYNTVRVRRARDKDSERETQIWFAKELDYVIVKFFQRESDGKSYELVIDQYEQLPLP